MPACPHCGSGIRLRELPHQGLFNSERICPHCAGSFTVDSRTKYRQAIFICVAVISSVLSLLLYFQSPEWLTPAIVSYFILALVIYWGNKRLFLVPVNETRNPTKETRKNT